MLGPEKRGRAFEHAVAGMEETRSQKEKDIETGSIEQVELQDTKKETN